MAEPAPRRYLIRLRKRLGYTQLALAALVEVDNSHISMIEAGLRTPRPDLTVRLAKALDVDIDVLLDYFENETPPSRETAVAS